jgi:hypothetical protein
MPDSPADTEVSGVVSSDGTEPVAPAEIEVSKLVPADESELIGQCSELCCQTEDAPLVGQCVEIACPVSFQVDAPKVIPAPSISDEVTISECGDNAKAQDVFELVKVGNEVSYMKRRDSGEIVCCYLGGSNKQTLRAWGEWLCVNHSVGSKFGVRTAQRLTQFKHELKVWGMSLIQIQT